MRRLGIVIVAGLVLATVGCTTKGIDDLAAASTTSTRPGTELGQNGAAGGSSTTTVGDSSTVSLPDLDALGDCFDVSAALAELGLVAAFATTDERSQLAQQLDDLEQRVPPDVQDDVATIVEGLQQADNADELAQFLSSSAYETALGDIQQYVASTCGTTGSDQGD